MLRCVQFVEQLSEVEEGTASLTTRLSFRLHRLTCRHCRRYLRQMRAVRAVMRNALGEPPGGAAEEPVRPAAR